MERIVEADTHALTVKLACRFEPSQDTPLPGPPPTAEEQHARWEPPPHNNRPTKRRRTIA